MENTLNKEIVILYHADCPDGFGAAWAAWKKLGDTAIYIPVRHRTAPPLEIRGREVYTIDYSYPKEVLERDVLPHAKKLTIIDHHVSTEPVLGLAPGSLYDTSHSGAVLSWHYFHPGVPVPRLLQYVEDIDLWKAKLPNARKISYAVNLKEYSFKEWDALATDMDDDKKFAVLVDQGGVLEQKVEKVVQKVVDSAETVVFEGYTCLMANSPFYVSEVGAALVKKAPPIGIVWSRRGNRIVVSLRGDGTVDLNKLAGRYGGGGHPNASAFSWDEVEFLKFKKPHNV